MKYDLQIPILDNFEQLNKSYYVDKKHVTYVSIY